MEKNVKDLCEEIQSFLKLNKAQQALTLCEEALLSFPDHIRLHLQKTQALIILNETSQALTDLLLVENKFNANQSYLLKLAHLYMRLKELNKAEHYFKCSYTLSQEHKPTLKGLIALAYRKHKWDEVIETSQKALMIFPQDIEFQSHIGHAYLKKQRFDEAEKFLQPLIKQEDCPLKSKLDYIEVFLKQEKNEEAENLLLPLCELLSVDTTAQFNKNRMIKLIQLSASPLLFQKVITLIESNTEAFSYQALTHLMHLALKLKTFQEAEYLYRYMMMKSNLNLSAAIVVFNFLVKTNANEIEKEIELIEGKLNHFDLQLFQIEISFQMRGALKAHELLTTLLSKEEIIENASKLMPIYIHAGKTEELLSLLEKHSHFDEMLLPVKVAYLNGLIRIGSFNKAISCLDQTKLDLLEMDPPLMKLQLQLFYFIGEYSKVTNFLASNPKKIIGLENILIWSLFESGQLLTLEQISKWSNILQVELKTRREQTLDIRMFIHDVHDLLNKSNEQKTLSYATSKVTTYYLNQISNKENFIPSSIPKVIVQYWDDNVPPTFIDRITQTWSSANSYEYHMFSKMNALKYVREHFDKKYLRALQLCRHPAEQADFFRLLYLSKNGGIYADADDLLIGSLDELISLSQGLILYKEPYGIGNNFIACVPNHPVLVATLEKTVHNLLSKTQETIWTKTGPGLLIMILSEYLDYMDQNSLEADVKILSRETFLPIIAPHCKLPYKGTDKAWLTTMQNR